MIRAFLWAIATLAIAVPALLVRYAPPLPVVGRALPALPPRRVVPQAELPPVEPIKLIDLSADQARA